MREWQVENSPVKSGKNVALNMTICSFDLRGGSQRGNCCRSVQFEGRDMTQPMIATLIAIGVIAILLLAVLWALFGPSGLPWPTISCQLLQRMR